jgi:effector-binding domain-containing protein
MFEPEIKTLAPETVAFVTMRGPYAQIPAGYGQLYGWIAQHGMSSEGMPIAVYLTSPEQTPEGDARWELWAPVATETAEQPADESGCGVKHIGERTVACAMHTGPYELLPQTYDPLMQWISGQGYATSGPQEEVYFSDPDVVPPEQYVTEVRVPIAKT